MEPFKKIQSKLHPGRMVETTVFIEDGGPFRFIASMKTEASLTFCGTYGTVETPANDVEKALFLRLKEIWRQENEYNEISRVAEATDALLADLKKQ